MSEEKKGALLLLCAYVFWGVLPIYWKAMEHLDPMEILAHRIAWSMVVALIVVAIEKKWYLAVDIIKRGHKTLLALTAASAAITFNWGLFIWAVNNGMILETSLGYFINPLMSILFGMVVFREKLSRAKWCAVALATVGVCIEVFSVGHLPYISLALAASFCLYGVIKKVVIVDSMVGLFIETMVATPFAVAWLVSAQRSGAAAFPYDTFTVLLLVVSGVVTNIPLALFAYALRRIPLSMAGFIQYASPTLTFLIGTLIYGEQLRPSRVVTFAFIWMALAVYTADTLLRSDRAS